MKKYSIILLFYTFIFPSFQYIIDQESEEPLSNFKFGKNYAIQKIENHQKKPIIDGVLDDFIWQDIIPIEDFIQRDPNIFENPTFKTEVKLLYDQKHIYLYAKLYHDEPKNIAKHVCRRDDWVACFDKAADWFSFELDPIHNHHSGYVFAVNASGVQIDALIFDDSEYDGEWNGVWSSEVSIDNDGWNIEMMIPFSNLNYKSK